jgi:dihydropyrimidinase
VRPLDLLIRGDRVVLPGVGAVAAEIGIRDRQIVGVYQPGEAPDAVETIDAYGRVVMPGAIEPHAHMQLAEWSPEEEFRSETVAAALGGVTTFMVYLIQPQPYRELFARMRAAAEGNALVDYAFHFALMNDRHAEEIPAYIEELGVTSFKFFMSYRGNEGAFLGIQDVDDGLLYWIMTILARHRGSVLCPHPENIEIAWRFRKEVLESGRADLAAWEASRPALVEAEAIHRVLFLSRHTGCQVYVVHVSSAQGLDVLRRERASGLAVVAESCPHYLMFTTESPQGALVKVAPPVRSAGDRRSLWEAVLDGSVDVMASDHVVRPRHTKGRDIWQATGGFPGVATTLPVLLSEGVHRRGMSIERVVELVSSAPARVFGMYPRKGAILPGSDADLVVLDLEHEEEVVGEQLGSAAGYSPYDGLVLKGWPVTTIAGGRVVMRERRLLDDGRHGQYVYRLCSPRSGARA